MSAIKRPVKTTARAPQTKASSVKTTKATKATKAAKVIKTTKAVKIAKVTKVTKAAKAVKVTKATKMILKDHQTRVEILQLIADKTNLKRVEVESVFSQMADIVRAHMAQNGSGEIMIPKLGLKIRKVRRKATKKRKMVSPLTGSEVIIPAKPARDDVKLIALKTLKAAVI